MKTFLRPHGLIVLVTLFILLGPGIFCALPPRACSAASQQEIHQEGLSEGVEHLLSLASRGAAATFDADLVRPVLEFVASEKEADTLYHAGERDGLPSAYHEFHVRRNLESILRYAYNPGIPANVFRPSSVRLTRWIEVDGEEKPIPRMWTFLPEPVAPEVVTGVEYEENTPELITGACYGYTMDRALVLFRSGGRNVFISISTQKGTSDKGRKGACLGGDANWDYLYTGEEGLTRQGLGWVDTHIYDASSIAVFTELGEEEGGVRCGIFKWIRAGWAGLNLVKRQHIHEGLVRFSRGFQETIEDAGLPESDRLERMFAWIESLSQDEISGKVNDYFQAVRSRYQGEDVFSKGCFEELVETGDYAGRMNRVQMESLVALEYMKWVLGRSTVLGEDLRFHPAPVARRISGNLPLSNHLNAHP